MKHSGKSAIITAALYSSIIILFFSGCKWGPDSADLEKNVWDNTTVEALNAPTSLEASAGIHETKIGLKWERVSNADSYKLYRSDNPDTGFTELCSLRETEIVPITFIENSGSTAPQINAPEFTSDVDLRQKNIFTGAYSEGIFILGSQTAAVNITIDDETKTVTFAGGWWGKTYTQNDIVTAINTAFGRTVCTAYTVSSTVESEKKRLLKIKTDRTANIGSIILVNKTNLVLYSAISTLLKSGIGKSGTVKLDPENIPGQTGTPSTYSYSYIDENIAAGTHYFYKIKAFKDSGIESGFANTSEGFLLIPGAPGVPKNIQSDCQDNKVIISWDSVSGATSYKVLRSKKQSGEYSIVSGTGGITSAVYEDTSVPPGMFYYKIAAVNSYGEGGHTTPYGAYRKKVTDVEFFQEFMRATKVSQDKIPSMGGFGNDTINGDVSGTCLYNSGWITFMSEVGVTITYTSYSDNYMVFNGEVFTDIKNINSQSGTLRKKVNIDGIYKGYVDHFLEISGGKANGGYYTIFQDGNSSSSNTPWNTAY